MSVLTRFEQLYDESRRNRWFRGFAVFCRIALALGFVPAGIVKVMGERFTALPSNHPLGHYFDALFLTGSYYKFIGLGQLTLALLLLVPRTALLGAILYFPVILNICVLAYAVRFEGTRGTTLMLLANVFLLVWDYDRLKHVLPFARADDDRRVLATTSRFPAWFFGFVFAAIVSVIVINQFLYDIRPGNSQEECTNGCKDNGSPDACQNFCGCIYGAGHPLNVCLDEYQRAKRSTPMSQKTPSAGTGAAP
ncbi:MAG TPA: DoxX family protein [Polyangia bacterium]|nr:DoxX family protein [Polyangia bacterium]